jgi:hypothetical protein
MRRLRTFAAATAALALAGCSGGSDPKLALDAALRIASAQFHRGAPPAENGGPKLSSITTQAIVYPGELDASVSGLTPPLTTGVLAYIDKDVGYYVITPGTPDPSQDFALTFSAPVTFSQLLPLGKFTLMGQAVDIHGKVGAVYKDVISVQDEAAPIPNPTTLLVSLSWDTQADLDLHLVIPDGTEIYSGKVNSVGRPSPGDTDSWKSGGILDYDSNGLCVIDGRRRENVYWTQTPPSGHYIVRVETYSMCSEAQANWSVAITKGSDPALAIVHGVSRDSDTLAKRGRGAGLTAFEFDIP